MIHIRVLLECTIQPLFQRLLQDKVICAIDHTNIRVGGNVQFDQFFTRAATVMTRSLRKQTQDTVQDGNGIFEHVKVTSFQDGVFSFSDPS